MIDVSTLEQRGYVLEIEQEVLGTLLLHGSFAEVRGKVRADHFLETIHARIFEMMELAAERYNTCRVDMVFKMFAKKEADAWSQKLNIPLKTYLVNLTGASIRGIPGMKDSVPNLIKQWARINVGLEAERLVSASTDPTIDPAHLIRTATQNFDDVAASLRGGSKGKTRFSISEAADGALNEVSEAMKAGTGLTGISWGLSDINFATGGIHRGEMVIIGARPGMGKTALALGIAIKAARSGAGVGFLSLEMGSNRLAMRALTDIAYDWNLQVPYTDLITGRVGEQDFEGICAAKQDLEKLPLWIEQQPGLSISELRVKLDQMQDVARRDGKTIDVLVVDYLQLLSASARYSGNRVNEVSEISAGLRQIARENNLAMVALSQLSRGVESRENKRPMLSDLRESGSLEQDADMVAFLYREAYYLAQVKPKDPDEEMAHAERLVDCQNKLEFIIAKQRNGEVKTVDLFIDVACSAVRNAARSY